MPFDAETKALFDEQAKTFEAFKAKNDELQAQVKKLGEDAVTRDAVEKLNKSLDELADKVKKADEANQDLEAKMGRMRLGGGGDTDVEAKAAKAWAERIGLKSDFSADQAREYKGAVNAWLRNPEAKTTTLNVGTDPSGGYFVSPDTTGRMVKKIYESTPMRQLAFIQPIGTDALEGPIDNGEADALWVGEQETRVQTDAPQVGMWRIEANELYAYPKVTQKLLEDASIDVEAWLGNKAADKIARKENTAFTIGDGVRKPKGLFSYAFAATADSAGRPWGTFEFIGTGTSGAFGGSNPADCLIDLVAALKAGYRQKAKFLMRRATVAAVRKLKDAYGQYLWQPSLQAGQPALLMGYPLVEGEDVPAIAANSYSIAFGDFEEAYTIVDRLGIGVIRDNITQPGFVKYNMRRRVGGGAVNFEAAKFLKFA